MAKTDEQTLVGMQAGMARFLAARSAPAAFGAAAKPRASERKPYGLGSQAPPQARSAQAAQGPAPAAGGATAKPYAPERKPCGLGSQVPPRARSVPGAQGSQGEGHGGPAGQAGAPKTPTKRREEDGQAGAARASAGAPPAGRGRQRHGVTAAAAARAPGRRLVQQRLQLGPLTPASREGEIGGGGASGSQAVQTPSAAAGNSGRGKALSEPAGGGADVVDLCTPSTGERGAGSPAVLGSGPTPRSGGSVVDLTQDDDS